MYSMFDYEPNIANLNFHKSEEDGKKMKKPKAGF
jgi:hypothetical protein